MKYHPATFMLSVWGGCIFLYMLLPFQLINKSLSLVGILAFLLFLLSFCFGSLLVPEARIKFRFVLPRIVDFRNADRYLKWACLIAIVACAADLYDKSFLNLTDAYQDRSARAGALLRGEVSSSSLAFQIAFLTYPAAYVFLVRQIIFENKFRFFLTFFYGLLPIILTMLSMGGRSPLLYAIIISIFAYRARGVLRKDYKRSKPKSRFKRTLFVISIVSIVSIAFYYFSAVFFVRAQSAGGSMAMLELAEQVWGIGFKGNNSELLFSLVGEDFSYLIFVFSWYLIQGFFMGNFLFTDYEGPLQLGVYGVDLISALMRRLDGELVARNFGALMDLGTYGFLPSAFGSLYVDLNYAGVFICMLWGALAALVYHRIKCNFDARWYLLAPFITMGILFSLINTPIGFTNGFVIHLWLIVAFVTSKDVNVVCVKDRCIGGK